ncbi:PBAN-type neuropeptides-like isoform X1 [Bombus impatiens]|uniref:PBAN-type neuropeptides-like isoform X1 n=1 Tax=Bombus impatiens TaxID=132113 RepID=A0A6P3UTR0_BOMIM|nr:PBAN-type neuropeptides-like isoform X1 [Bombus impatiens]XP_024223225.1 PBAN-type neuropeptides-like isoform X1 [Bombus impatiens]
MHFEEILRKLGQRPRNYIYIRVIILPFPHVSLFVRVILFQIEGRDSSSSTSNDRAPSNEFGSCSDGKCIKRTSQDITSGMWFGPRLGRRRRTDRKPELDFDIETLANALDGSRWAIITIPGTDRRQAKQFTPRLGRESGEEYFSYGFPNDQEELYAEEQIFPPLFAPRLGRKVPWIPTPRLGRQLHNIIDKPRQNFDDARF